MILFLLMVLGLAFYVSSPEQRKRLLQAALAAVHGEATAIRAMAMDAGCAVARGPAHQRAAW
jgi:hypothetical protein